jgi:hypothetical protein
VEAGGGVSVFQTSVFAGFNTVSLSGGTTASMNGGVTQQSLSVMQPTAFLNVMIKL